MVLRIGFRIKRFRFDREKLTQLFVQERSEIIELVDRASEEHAFQPVLIDRIRGIEDSSRCWSVYMTIDHLRIVNQSIAAVIGLLTQGSVPKNKVSVAAAKPSADADVSVVEEFEDVCDEYLKVVRSQDSLRTQQKHLHPWIGAMNALDWHALASKHMSIHRTQIEHILRSFEET